MADIKKMQTDVDKRQTLTFENAVESSAPDIYHQTLRLQVYAF